MRFELDLEPIREIVRDAVAAAVADLEAGRPLVYTVDELAAELRVSPGTVRALVRSGRLCTLDLDGSRTVRIPAAAVDALLAQPQEPPR